MKQYENTIWAKISHFNMNSMDIKEIIKQSGLKLTNPRKELIELLDRVKKPICYNDIRNELPMDKATFYRTMNSFEEANIVTSIDSSDKKRYYELKKESHSHFSCNECHAIECLSNTHVIELDGHEIQSVTIHGKCVKCNSK